MLFKKKMFSKVGILYQCASVYTVGVIQRKQPYDPAIRSRVVDVGLRRLVCK